MTGYRDELVALRDLAGLTQIELGERIGASNHSVSSWERGLRAPSPKFQRLLAEALGVELTELHRALGNRATLDLEGHLVEDWLSHYDSLVLAAGHIATVELNVVPHLLQTREYATALERLAPGATETQVHERVESRMVRQHPVTRASNPAKLATFLDESVLRRRIGGPQVMRPQLAHLAEMSSRENITIRVIPDDGSSAYVISAFELLTKPGRTKPFMAVTRDLTGAHYHEGFKRRPFFDAWNHAQLVALSARDSARLIEDITTNHHR